MSYRILVINPGSTTTKIAVYDGTEAVLVKNVEHDAAKIASFATMAEQAPYRKEYISKALAENGIDESTLDCVMCRGGLIYVPRSEAVAISSMTIYVPRWLTRD